LNYIISEQILIQLYILVDKLVESIAGKDDDEDVMFGESKKRAPLNKPTETSIFDEDPEEDEADPMGGM